MDFKVGDRVKYKEYVPAGGVRWKQIGTIVEVIEMPTSEGPRVNIKFEIDDEMDRGISAHQIEHTD